MWKHLWHLLLFRYLIPKSSSDAFVEKRYVDAGLAFGDLLSYSYMGAGSGYERLLSRWEFWEAVYAERGFRTIPLDAFIDAGGYGAPLPPYGIRRPSGENAVRHAKNFRASFPVEPTMNSAIRRLIAGMKKDK